MPGSASSQQNTRSSAKARPSANVRAANLVANTPVLFRLPAIQDIPGRGTAKTEVKSDASIAAVAIPMSPTPESITSSQSAEAPVEPVTATQPSTQRSWWEHWSSGVVLIILLIALATASILALQGSSGKQNSKLIAESEKAEESLSGIETGTINQSLAIIQPQPGSLDLSLDSGSVNTLDARKTSNLDDRKPANNMQSDESLLSTGALLEAEASSPAAQVSKVEAPSLSQAKPRETSQPDNKATVSLQAPIGKSASNPLEIELPESPKAGVQASPASSNVKKSAGASPDTWDSSKSDSKLDLTQPSIQFDDPNSLSSATENSGSLMVPSALAATALGGSSIDAKTAQATQQLSEPLPPKTSPTTLGQGLMMTATPEWDREQLLRTFLKLREQAAGASGNRYPQTTNAPSVAVAQPNGFNVQQVPPTSNQSFTLQPNQQPSGTQANSGVAPSNMNAPNYR